MTIQQHKAHAGCTVFGWSFRRLRQRADDRCDGIGWSDAPRSSMETEATQCHHWERRSKGTEERRRWVLWAELRRGRGACEGDTTGTSVWGGWAARAGFSGAQWSRPRGAASRLSRAAGGAPTLLCRSRWSLNLFQKLVSWSMWLVSGL